MIEIQISTSCRCSLQSICRNLFDERIAPSVCRERLYLHIKRYHARWLIHEQIEQVVEGFMERWHLA